MEYGRLGLPEPTNGTSASTRSLTPDPTRAPKKSRLKLFLLLVTTLIAASAVAAALIVVVVRNRVDDSGAASALHARRPSQAMSNACSKTRYPNLCLNSLLDFPGATTASAKDLVHISVNMTLRKFGRALYSAAEISNLKMDPHVRSAFDDCLELLDDSVDLLSRSLTTVAPGGGGGSTQDVLTWLSASLTNQDTCTDGFAELNGYVKNQMVDRLKDLSDLVSNCLAIYAAAAGDDDFAGIPIQNRRRLLEHENAAAQKQFPAWLSRRDRKLLQLPVTTISADIIVSHDGNGTCKTIAEAIKKAPEYSNRRFIIYVRAGKYEEDILKVGRKKTNLMFIGDGKGKTVISGGKNVQQNMTTFHTASFAATGAGFIARDITFENWAGPSKHQAVALRVGADHAVIYRCNIIGYQDTLYAHSQRQFYRECDIYGTVDFIFGNAAAVFQSCGLYLRRPRSGGAYNVILANGRSDPGQSTGFSVQNCRITVASDFSPVRGSYKSYLGRPWKLYSRAVVMQSNIDGAIASRGWVEWPGAGGNTYKSLYFAEYANMGGGAGTGGRVNWPGFKVLGTAEASKFTVANFIGGNSWLPSTGVTFVSGL